jgi:hypothetical protein
MSAPQDPQDPPYPFPGPPFPLPDPDAPPDPDDDEPPPVPLPSLSWRDPHNGPPATYSADLTTSGPRPSGGAPRY